MAIPELPRAPKFSVAYKRQAEIPFSGTVGAGAQLTLLSGRIMYPFRIILVKMIFTDDANNLIRHYWMVSGTDDTSVTGLPSGINIFGQESPTAYFVGKAIIRVVPCNIEYPEGRLYIKLHTNNTSAYAYVVNGSIIIQEL